MWTANSSVILPKVNARSVTRSVSALADPRHTRDARQATALGEPAHLLHQLLHLAELFDERVHIGHGRPRALRDPASARSIQDRGVLTLGARHRRDDRLDLLHLRLGLRALGHLLREAAHAR